MDLFTSEGLGLGYRDLRLDVSTDGWVRTGSLLRDQLAALLERTAAGVEHIGSSAVVGLLAKPIIDLAVGVPVEGDLAAIRSELEGAGWIYRGDAGDQGGHVFVLEARPWFRVAHVHVVEYGGDQWLDYLRLRHLLRWSADARARYAAAKSALVAEIGIDRNGYTERKTGVVRSLLSHGA